MGQLGTCNCQYSKIIEQNHIHNQLLFHNKHCLSIYLLVAKYFLKSTIQIKGTTENGNGTLRLGTTQLDVYNKLKIHLYGISHSCNLY